MVWEIPFWSMTTTTLGWERNEILMWNTEFPAIGQLQSERLKTVMQPVSNLFDEHAAKIPTATGRINIFSLFYNFNSASVTAP